MTVFPINICYDFVLTLKMCDPRKGTKIHYNSFFSVLKRENENVYQLAFGQFSQVSAKDCPLCNSLGMS